MNNDILKLAEMLGLERQEINRAALASFYNPGIAGEIRNAFLVKAQREGIDILIEDPFLPCPKQEDLKGEIEVGKVIQNGQTFGIRMDKLYNILVVGEIRSGKTNLIYRIIESLADKTTFLVFDLRRDYRHLVRKLPQIQVIRAKELRYNPLRPPDNVPPKDWLGLVCEVFCHVFKLLVGSREFLIKVLDELYRIYRVYEGSDCFPTLGDLLTLLESKKYLRDNMCGQNLVYLQRITGRLKGVIILGGEIFNIDRGFDFKKLMDSCVVLEMESIDEYLQNYLIIMIIYWTYFYRMYNRGYSL